MIQSIIQFMGERLTKVFSKNDSIYFLYSVLFYEIFFKLTRRYYYFFENTLDYYFSFLSENYFYSSYSFLMLTILISLFSILINKVLSINYFFSNLLSFICILFTLKISDFPRSNFFYLLVLFPIIYFLIEKLQVNYNVKVFLLISSIIISLSNHSYYFEARETSYLSNIKAQDYSFTVSNLYQDRDQLYDNPYKIAELRTITFNQELVSKEFILCCENIKSSFTKGKPIGYIEKFDDNLMYISGTGDLFVMSINSLNTESVTEFKRVDSNFRDLVENEYIYGIDERFGWGGWESVKNIFYDKGYLYVSYIDETEEDCATLSILRGEANITNIKFSKFFSLDKCIPRTNDNYTGIQSGGAITNYDDDNLIFTTGDFRQRLFPQNQNSQYGKTLKINKNDATYQILSMGHRNPQGIKKIKDDLFISTEHGPRMGDEINLIDTSVVNNYGWPIASYGVHYNSNFGINFIFEELMNAPLHKSHFEYGFEEPIYYFGFDKIIEHGISDIEIISNNETTLDFMFGSLHYGRLYIASYDLLNSSMESLQSFNIQNRIRDLLKISKNDYIALLENPPRLAVIALNSN